LIFAAEIARARSFAFSEKSIFEQARQDIRFRLLVGDVHVDDAMLQRLEGADRHAELLARLQVLERGIAGELHRPDRLGADERGGEVDRFLDLRQAAGQRLGFRAGEDEVCLREAIDRAPR